MANAQDPWLGRMILQCSLTSTIIFLTMASSVAAFDEEPASVKTSAPTVNESPEFLASLQAATKIYSDALNAPEREQRRRLFRKSQQLFSQTVEAMVNRGDQPSVELWVAYGNAALQNEDLGVAVAAFRQAVQLSPSAPQANQNLNYARSLVPVWAPTERVATSGDTLFFWQNWLAPTVQAGLAAISLLVAAVCISLAILLKKKALALCSLGPLAVWAILFAGSSWDVRNTSRCVAIVTADECILRTADSALAPPRLNRPLPAGAELPVLQEQTDWIEVETNGRSGWLQRTQVVVVK